MVQESFPTTINFPSTEGLVINSKTFERGNDKSSSRSSQTIINDTHVPHSHQGNSSIVGIGRQIALRDFFTVLAISFHAVFEGLAVGLTPDSADIWILFAGTEIHYIREKAVV